MKRFSAVLLLVTLIGFGFQALAQSPAPVLVPNNSYAFQWTGDSDIGLFFNSSAARFEFRDLDANTPFWWNALNGRAYIQNRLGIGVPNPSTALQVEGESRFGNIANRATIGSSGDLSFQGSANYLVGNNDYAFKYLGGNQGLFFNTTDLRYEFLNGLGDRVFSVNVDGADGDIWALGNMDVEGTIVSTDTIKGNEGQFISSSTNKADNGGGAFTVGPLASSHLGFDANEVQSYIGETAAGVLFINYYGGAIDVANPFGGDTDFSVHGGTIYMDGLDNEVGIGTSNPLVKFHIKQAQANAAMRIEHQSTTEYWNTGLGNSTKNYRFEYLSNFRAQISTVDGAYTNSSDRRLKSDIELWEVSMDDIMKLKPSKYYYLDSEEYATNKSHGFIAQEVEEVFPELVRIQDDENSNKVLAYDDFAILAIAGLQLQQQQIETLAAAEELENLKDELEIVKAESQVWKEENERLIDRLDRVDALLAQFDKSLAACCILHEDGKEIEGHDDPSLGQNIPNPFTTSSWISYYLPQGSTYAKLTVTDLSGRMIKSYDLESFGFGQVEFSHSEIAAGTYLYTLILNGKRVDTKQMVLVK